MFEQLTQRMEFFSSSLQLRAHRQQVLASNIANADSPGYVAREFDFASALRSATGVSATGSRDATGGATLPLAAPVSGGAGGLNVPGSTAGLVQASHSGHMRAVGTTGAVTDKARLAYTVQTQPSLDGNSVDMDQQRANFTDNAIRYESTLRFINGHVRTMLSAIQGQ